MKNLRNMPAHAGFTASGFVSREGRRLADALWREGPADLTLRALRETPEAVTLLAEAGDRERLVRHFPAGEAGARRFRRERAARRRLGEAGLIGRLLVSDQAGRFLISTYVRGVPAHRVLRPEDLARRIGRWLGRAAATGPRRRVSANWADLAANRLWPVGAPEAAARLPVHALAPARDDGAVERYVIGAGDRFLAQDLAVAGPRPLAWDFALTARMIARKIPGADALAILADSFAEEAKLDPGECFSLAKAAAAR